MRERSNSWSRRFVALLLSLSVLPWSMVAQNGDQDNSGFNLKRNVEIVLVNVVVRDKQGNIIRGLKKDDFTITEEAKPQMLSSFDFEETDTQALPPLETQPTIMGMLKNAPAKTTPA